MVLLVFNPFRADLSRIWQPAAYLGPQPAATSQLFSHPQLAAFLDALRVLSQ